MHRLGGRMSDRRGAFVWTPEYATGIHAIDDDHKGLFAVIDALDQEFRSGQPDKQIGSTIDALKRYAEEHFAREERLMQSAHTPECAAHIRAHRKFTHMIEVLAEIHAEDPQQVDIEKVLGFLTDWLKNHILKTDLNYVPYLTGQASADDTGATVDAAADCENTDRQTVTVTVNKPDDDVVAELALLLNSGGEIAYALREAVHGLASLQRRRDQEEARELFGRATTPAGA